MKSPYDVIIKPLLTEESYDNMADRKYTFIVDKNANKTEIKQAIEAIFGVTVEKVNTQIREGKVKRRGRFVGQRPTVKRAVIKLTENSKTIEFFEGMA